MSVEKGVVYHFPPFWLDGGAGRLWEGGEQRRLRRKTFALLRYLVAHAGQLACKDDLMAEGWPDVTVNEVALAVCIHELRRVLRDDAASPCFIETAHGSGYRFIAPVTISHDHAEAQRRSASPVLVGRESDLSLLLERWKLALEGARQVIFVGGEPGIGKTALIDHFLSIARESGPVLIGRGQCVEQYGEGEAYLPILEALGRMCHGAGSCEMRDVLRRLAPSWFAQLQGIVEATEAQAVQLQAARTARPRMLREMAEALEFIAATRPVIVVCEDLHAGDRSTVEMIDYVARRRGAARLTILATHRDGETTPCANLLRRVVQNLGAHRQCLDLSLKPLSEPAVTQYLRRRLAVDALPAPLAHQVYRRTGGNPLFMVALVEHLHARGVAGNGGAPLESDLGALGVPGSVRKMIERQMEELSADDRRLLEVASVAGVEFSAAALSAGLSARAASAQGERAETQCEDLARRTHFLSASGIAHWPDGTVAGSYRFRHAMYQEVLYERVSAARRVQLHQKIGERIEAGHRVRATEIAAELAMHFERGGDHYRAAKYFAKTAETALARSAHKEAVAYTEKGLALLSDIPNHVGRAQAELALQMLRGTALMARLGMAAAQVETAFERTRQLVAEMGATAGLAPVMLGIAKFHLVRRELDAAQRLAQDCLQLAQDDVSPRLEAHAALAAILFARGEFSAALDHANHAIALYDPEEHRSHALSYGLDPGVVGRVYAAMSLWRLGYADQARKLAREAVAIGQGLSHIHTWSFALSAAASICVRCRDWTAAEARSDEILSLTAENELPLWHAWANVFRGQALAAQARLDEGLGLIREAIAAMRASGAASRQAEIDFLLTRVEKRTIEPEEGLQIAAGVLAEIDQNGELLEKPELQRITGILKLQSCGQRANPASVVEAEESFRDAVETARSQQAKALELRATLNLSRLLRQRGEGEKAREMLTRLYNWFTEGFDTGDLQEAKAFLAELGQ